MALALPKLVGPYTLEQALAPDEVSERYQARLEGDDASILIQRLLPHVVRDVKRLAALKGRVADLSRIGHQTLFPVLDWIEDGNQRYVASEAMEGVTLAAVIEHCRQEKRAVPPNVFLNLATQLCTGLEVLHARPGNGTGAEHVLHLRLSPSTVVIDGAGRVRMGGYGLTRSPASLPQAGGGGALPMEYLSPEQTHPDKPLQPTSDIFALATLLYEVLTQEVLFKADSNLQTIHRVRRAEVTTQLLSVKEKMPGLDKVLYRMLSLDPAQRYKRAFVVREDLRGLMSGYSFRQIEADTLRFVSTVPEAAGLKNLQSNAVGFEEEIPTRVDSMSTAVFAAQARADRMADLRQQRIRAEVQRDDPLPIEDTDTAPPTDEEHGERPTRPIPDDEDSPTAVEFATEPGAPPHPGLRPPGSGLGFLGRKTGPSSPQVDPDEDTLEPLGLGDLGRPTHFEAPDAPMPKRTQADRVPFSRNLPPPKAKKPPPPDPTPPRPQPEPARPQPERAPPSPVSDPKRLELELELPEAPPVTEEHVARKQRGLLVGLSAGVFVLILTCAGVLYMAIGHLGDRMEEEPDSTALAEQAKRVDALSQDEVFEDEPEVEEEEVVEEVVEQPKAPPPRRPKTKRREAPVITTPPNFGFEASERAIVDPSLDAPEDLGEISSVSSDLNRYRDDATRGRLTNSEILVLEMVDIDDAAYTRSRSLLIMNARANSDLTGTKRYLDQLMVLPENQYNPLFLTELGKYFVNSGDYRSALDKVSLAERYWARLPSTQIFLKKAEIYEVQAASYQGLFYGNDADTELLDQAIRHWKKYRQHVNTKSRGDLAQRADKELAKLEDIRFRLE